MSFFSFLKKKEPILSIDIGASGIKCLEFDPASSNPSLLNIAMAPLSSDVFSGYSISNAQKVADQIQKLLESNSIDPKRVATAMSAPSVFAKKVNIDKMDRAEIKNYMEMEAQNIVPHNIDAVRVDHHVLSENDEGIELLVVAVKNEVVDSYLETFDLCGLQVAVVDVDYFALQNMYELNYPELLDSTVALINVGARYSAINICKQGSSIFTGDMSVGGKSLTDALVEEAGLSQEEAEKLKRTPDLSAPELDAAREIIKTSIDGIAAEFNRQLSLFWNASGTEGTIDKILISGGASQLAGLTEGIKEKTGIECEKLNPFHKVHYDDTFDDDYIKNISPFMGVAVGMAIRQAGDKE